MAALRTFRAACMRGLATTTAAAAANGGGAQVPAVMDAVEVAAAARAGTVRVIDMKVEPLFAVAHIPGALPFPVPPTLKGAGTGRVLPPVGFGQVLAALQVRPGQRLVFVDDGSMLNAARVWWAFKYYGLDDVSVLDGGWAAYVAAALPAEAGDAPAAASQSTSSRSNASSVGGGQTPSPVATPRPAWLTTTDDLAAAVRDGRTVSRAGVAPPLQVLDARTVPEFAGVELRGNMRGGHVPGAINVPHASLYRGGADTRLKTPAALRDLFLAAALDPTRPTAAYCQAGIRAALAALALHHAGFPTVSVYDASMAEWLNRPDTPVEMSTTSS